MSIDIITQEEQLHAALKHLFESCDSCWLVLGKNMSIRTAALWETMVSRDQSKDLNRIKNAVVDVHSHFAAQGLLSELHEAGCLRIVPLSSVSFFPQVCSFVIGDNLTTVCAFQGVVPKGSSVGATFGITYATRFDGENGKKTLDYHKKLGEIARIAIPDEVEALTAPTLWKVGDYMPPDPVDRLKLNWTNNEENIWDEDNDEEVDLSDWGATEVALSLSNRLTKEQCYGVRWLVGQTNWEKEDVSSHVVNTLIDDLDVSMCSRKEAEDRLYDHIMDSLMVYRPGALAILLEDELQKRKTRSLRERMGLPKEGHITPEMINQLLHECDLQTWDEQRSCWRLTAKGKKYGIELSGGIIIWSIITLFESDLQDLIH